MPPGRPPHQAYCAGRAQQLLLPRLPALTLNTSTWSAWSRGSVDTACAIVERLVWRTAWSSHPCSRSVWTARPDVTPLVHVDRPAYVWPRRALALPGTPEPYPGTQFLDFHLPCGLLGCSQEVEGAGRTHHLEEGISRSTVTLCVWCFALLLQRTPPVVW